jgi:NADPH:quinone reductase-like Zn-dependent oxidoreductase
MIQSTMKAIALDRFGGLETMKLQILPVPEVGPNEVLIHVEWAAGTGPFEVHVARSFPLDQAAEAHRMLDEHYLGKLALQTA